MASGNAMSRFAERFGLLFRLRSSTSQLRRIFVVSGAPLVLRARSQNGDATKGGARRSAC
jgi:hypothetical protein